MSVRRVEDVRVRQEIGPVQVPVTREILKAYADASGDQNPIHQDEEFAKSVGLPDVIAHGMWTMGATGSVVAAWAGDAGRILDFRTRFTKPVVVPASGATIAVSGVVKAVDEEARRATVELTTTADGEKVLGRCIALVQLD